MENHNLLFALKKNVRTVSHIALCDSSHQNGIPGVEKYLPQGSKTATAMLGHPDTLLFTPLQLSYLVDAPQKMIEHQRNHQFQYYFWVSHIILMDGSGWKTLRT